MKWLLRFGLVGGLCWFSYFSYTKVETSRSRELRVELDNAQVQLRKQAATIKLWEEKGVADKTAQVGIHKTLTLIFPDREQQFGEILGVLEPVPAEEAEETDEEKVEE